MPSKVRPKHDACFFMHDEAARLLVEHELAGTNVVDFSVKDGNNLREFQKLAKKHGPLHAMRKLGFEDEARRVIMNQITFAMTSDFLHHIYEALKCLEKRKFIVALNLLRKPLQDSLPFLAWMLADEDDFYDAFTRVGPTALTAKAIGNKRAALIEKAIKLVYLDTVTSAASIQAAVFDRRNAHGLYPLFQKAVHLVTAKYEEVATETENFNFIFKNPLDDDVYFGIYDDLAELMLFASHVILGLFGRIRLPDQGSVTAFKVRTGYAYRLAVGDEAGDLAAEALSNMLGTKLNCPKCAVPMRFTPRTAMAAVTGERVYCLNCRRVSPLPFSWLF